MTRKTGGVDYDETARLVHGRRDASPGGAELHVISRSAPLDTGDAADENTEEQLLAAEAEALFAAGRIRELLWARALPTGREIPETINTAT